MARSAVVPRLLCSSTTVTAGPHGACPDRRRGKGADVLSADPCSRGRFRPRELRTGDYGDARRLEPRPRPPPPDLPLRPGAVATLRRRHDERRPGDTTAAHRLEPPEIGQCPSGSAPGPAGSTSRGCEPTTGAWDSRRFVVRPRRLGEHRVAVVLPTLTWQAYNLRDENGDGRGDSWYADSRTSDGSARTAVPQPWRAHQLPALRPAFPELGGTNRKAGRRALPVGSRVSLELERTRRGLRPHRLPWPSRVRDDSRVRPRRGLPRSRRQSRFPVREQLLLAGRETRRRLVTRTERWRDLGRPEAALIGVQYVANGQTPRRPWIVRTSGAGSWLFAGTDLPVGSAFSLGGVEIDRTTPASPPGVEVVAEIPDLFGPGTTAQMTYYESREQRARVRSGRLLPHPLRQLGPDDIPHPRESLGPALDRLSDASRANRPRRPGQLRPTVRPCARVCSRSPRATRSISSLPGFGSARSLHAARLPA